jgi:hypothetical protein
MDAPPHSPKPDPQVAPPALAAALHAPPPPPPLATPGHHPILLELPEVGEFTRMALWMVGAFAGLSTPTHASLGRHFRAMAKRLGWPVGRDWQEPSGGAEDKRGKPAGPSAAAAMTLLADALVGSSRSAIASVFGPPRCAVAADRAVLAGDAVWRGQVWYYPINHPSADAVAVEFDGEEQARRVVFVGLQK